MQLPALETDHLWATIDENVGHHHPISARAPACKSALSWGKPHKTVRFLLPHPIAKRYFPAKIAEKRKAARAGRAGRIRRVAATANGGRCDQAALSNPSWVSAVTPSSRPISSTILPSITLSTVVPVKCILRPVAAGRPPIRKSSKAGPVWVPPPSH